MNKQEPTIYSHVEKRVAEQVRKAEATLKSILNDMKQERQESAATVINEFDMFTMVEWGMFTAHTEALLNLRQIWELQLQFLEHIRASTDAKPPRVCPSENLTLVMKAMSRHAIKPYCSYSLSVLIEVS